jgi:hypothetical protein
MDIFCAIFLFETIFLNSLGSDAVIWELLFIQLIKLFLPTKSGLPLLKA